MIRLKPSKTTQINAIHADDALDLLELLGASDAYRDGTLRCAICEQPVLTLGIGAVRRQDERFVFACGRLDCIRELS